jgi:4-amino-4-deoxy-L-arabinose transferase-like glycosyltransferase
MQRFRSHLYALRDAFIQLRQRHDLIYLFIFALVLRLCYLMLMLGQLGSNDLLNLSPDATRYVNIGRGLAEFTNADEGALVIFGPGYGIFLGISFFLFGINPICPLLAQIILSSICCLMLYRLGRELTGIKAIGYIAGYLSALSFTSISLSAFLLSDTLFFFLFLWGNLVLVLGLKNMRRSYFMLAGILIGSSILVRSIGQFWPLVILLIVLLWPRERPLSGFPHHYFKLVGRTMITISAALFIVVFWVGRNYTVHGVPMVAFTGAGGPANVARLTMANVENRDPGDIAADWHNDYSAKTGVKDLSYADQYRMFIAGTRKTLKNYPGEMLATYLDLVWQNLHEGNELFRLQLPFNSHFILDKVYWLRDRSLHFLNFWLSLVGLVILLLMRQWKAAIFLGAVYLYFVSMIGFTQWQGSRLFYPGMIAWSIIIASIPVAIVGWGRVAFRFILKSGRVRHRGHEV